ncbi:MAG: DedA family protein [Pseudonocardiales bacterium]|nr:DedA family protein [Pseudonocardiales bacterium]MBV9648955.1 DedA family protein [Pseudonocardiales bacterium]
MAPELPGVFAWLAPILDSYGYLAVFGFLFIESFGAPVPGQTMLMAAGVFAGAGRLNVIGIAVLGFLAAVAGDNVGYLIGHFGGRRLVLRFGRYIFITEKRLAKAEDFFARHGGKIVGIARFIEGLRQLNGVVAGIAGMPWRRFLAFNALGAAVWVAVWTSFGYVAGGHLGEIYERFSRYQILVLVVIGGLILAVVAHRLWRWQRHSFIATRSGR